MLEQLTMQLQNTMMRTLQRTTDFARAHDARVMAFSNASGLTAKSSLTQSNAPGRAGTRVAAWAAELTASRLRLASSRRWQKIADWIAALLRRYLNRFWTPFSREYSLAYWKRRRAEAASAQQESIEQVTFARTVVYERLFIPVVHERLSVQSNTPEIFSWPHPRISPEANLQTRPMAQGQKRQTATAPNKQTASVHGFYVAKKSELTPTARLEPIIPGSLLTPAISYSTGHIALFSGKALPKLPVVENYRLSGLRSSVLRTREVIAKLRKDDMRVLRKALSVEPLSGGLLPAKVPPSVLRIQETVTILRQNYGRVLTIGLGRAGMDPLGVLSDTVTGLLAGRGVTRERRLEPLSMPLSYPAMPIVSWLGAAAPQPEPAPPRALPPRAAFAVSAAPLPNMSFTMPSRRQAVPAFGAVSLFAQARSRFVQRPMSSSGGTPTPKFERFPVPASFPNVSAPSADALEPLPTVSRFISIVGDWISRRFIFPPILRSAFVRRIQDHNLVGNDPIKNISQSGLWSNVLLTQEAIAIVRKNNARTLSLLTYSDEQPAQPAIAPNAARIHVFSILFRRSQSVYSVSVPNTATPPTPPVLPQRLSLTPPPALPTIGFAFSSIPDGPARIVTAFISAATTFISRFDIKTQASLVRFHTPKYVDKTAAISADTQSTGAPHPLIGMNGSVLKPVNSRLHDRAQSTVPAGFAPLSSLVQVLPSRVKNSFKQMPGVLFRPPTRPSGLWPSVLRTREADVKIRKNYVRMLRDSKYTSPEMGYGIRVREDAWRSLRDGYVLLYPEFQTVFARGGTKFTAIPMRREQKTYSSVWPAAKRPSDTNAKASWERILLPFVPTKTSVERYIAKRITERFQASPAFSNKTDANETTLSRLIEADHVVQRNVARNVIRGVDIHLLTPLSKAAMTWQAEASTPRHAEPTRPMLSASLAAFTAKYSTAVSQGLHEFVTQTARSHALTVLNKEAARFPFAGNAPKMAEAIRAQVGKPKVADTSPPTLPTTISSKAAIPTSSSPLARLRIPGTKNVSVSEASPSVLTNAILPEDLRRRVLVGHLPRKATNASSQREKQTASLPVVSTIRGLLARVTSDLLVANTLQINVTPPFTMAPRWTRLASWSERAARRLSHPRIQTKKPAPHTVEGQAPRLVPQHVQAEARLAQFMRSMAPLFTALPFITFVPLALPVYASAASAALSPSVTAVSSPYSSQQNNLTESPSPSLPAVSSVALPSLVLPSPLATMPLSRLKRATSQDAALLAAHSIGTFAPAFTSGDGSGVSRFSPSTKSTEVPGTRFNLPIRSQHPGALWTRKTVTENRANESGPPRISPGRPATVFLPEVESSAVRTPRFEFSAAIFADRFQADRFSLETPSVLTWPQMADSIPKGTRWQALKTPSALAWPRKPNRPMAQLSGLKTPSISARPHVVAQAASAGISVDRGVNRITLPSLTQAAYNAFLRKITAVRRGLPLFGRTASVDISKPKIAMRSAAPALLREAWRVVARMEEIADTEEAQVAAEIALASHAADVYRTASAQRDTLRQSGLPLPFRTGTAVPFGSHLFIGSNAPLSEAVRLTGTSLFAYAAYNRPFPEDAGMEETFEASLSEDAPNAENKTDAVSPVGREAQSADNLTFGLPSSAQRAVLELLHTSRFKPGFSLDYSSVSPAAQGGFAPFARPQRLSSQPLVFLPEQPTAFPQRQKRINSAPALTLRPAQPAQVLTLTRHQNQISSAPVLIQPILDWKSPRDRQAGLRVAGSAERAVSPPISRNAAAQWPLTPPFSPDFLIGSDASANRVSAKPEPSLVAETMPLAALPMRLSSGAAMANVFQTRSVQPSPNIIPPAVTLTDAGRIAHGVLFPLLSSYPDIPETPGDPESREITPPTLAMRPPAIVRQSSVPLRKATRLPQTLSQILPIRGTNAVLVPPFSPAVTGLPAVSTLPAHAPQRNLPLMPAKRMQAYQPDPLRVQRADTGATSAATPINNQSNQRDTAQANPDGEERNAAAEINLLAHEVWSLLKRRLANEAERMGRG